MELGLSPSLEQTAPRAEHSLHRHLQIPGSAGQDGAGGFPWGSEGSSPGSAVGGMFSRPADQLHPGDLCQLPGLPGVALLPQNRPVPKRRLLPLGVRELLGVKAPTPQPGKGCCSFGWESVAVPSVATCDTPVALLWHSCGTAGSARSCQQAADPWKLFKALQDIIQAKIALNSFKSRGWTRPVTGLGSEALAQGQ